MDPCVVQADAAGWHCLSRSWLSLQLVRTCSAGLFPKLDWRWSDCECLQHAHHRMRSLNLIGYDNHECTAAIDETASHITVDLHCIATQQTSRYSQPKV